MADWFKSILNGRQVWRQVLTVPSGTSADHGRAIGVDPTTGTIHPGLIGSGGGSGGETIQASESIPSQSLVSQHYDGGRRIRLGQGTLDRQVTGYVAVGVDADAMATVVPYGIITLPIGSTGITDADASASSVVYADPAVQGTVTLTQPNTPGSAIQPLGRIWDVNEASGWMKINFYPYLANEVSES